MRKYALKVLCGRMKAFSVACIDNLPRILNPLDRTGGLRGDVAGEGG